MQAALGALFTSPVSDYLLAAITAHSTEEPPETKELRDNLQALVQSLGQDQGAAFDATVIKNSPALRNGFGDNFANMEQQSAVSFIQCLLNALGVLYRNDATIHLTRLVYEGKDMHELFCGFIKRPILMIANTDMLLAQRPRTDLVRLFAYVRSVTTLDEENQVEADGKKWSVLSETVMIRDAPMLILVIERPPGVALEVDAPQSLIGLQLSSVIMYTGNGNSGHWSYALQKNNGVDITQQGAVRSHGSVFVYINQ